MSAAMWSWDPPRVALLAEGVGRNQHMDELVRKEHAVALLAEGVGRNWTWRAASARSCRRPPRGGRG